MYAYTHRWSEHLESAPLDFPEDVTQIPDIMVYLLNYANKPVCFCRMKPYETLADGRRLIGFDRKAEWYNMQEDKVINALNDDDFPGNVLLQIGFGLEPDAKEQWVRDMWKRCLLEAKMGSPYQVRVHLYQAKDLPATDSKGLSDPYVKVNFMGHTKRSSVQENTLFPQWYETIVFDSKTIPEADDFAFAPEVTLNVYDKDIMSTDDYLGCTHYNLNK
jgi:hypothetical protein